MRHIHFKEANKFFTKPADMADEECSSISAHLGSDHLGRPYINTVWMPNKEDIDAINAGRGIIVTIYGPGLPPMSLFTLDENDMPNI